MGLFSWGKKDPAALSSTTGAARGNSIDVAPDEISRHEIEMGVAELKMRASRYQSHLIAKQNDPKTNPDYPEMERDQHAHNAIKFFADPEQAKLYKGAENGLRLMVETGLWVADQERRGFPAAMKVANEARERDLAKRSGLATLAKIVDLPVVPPTPIITLPPDLQRKAHQDRAGLQNLIKDPQALLMKLAASQEQHADIVVITVKTSITAGRAEETPSRGLLFLSLRVDPTRRDEAIQTLQQGVEAGSIPDRLRNLGAKLHSVDGLPSVLRCDATGRPLALQFHTDGKLGSVAANDVGRVTVRADGGVYCLDYWHLGTIKAIAGTIARVGWNTANQPIFADMPNDAAEKHSSVGDEEYILRRSGSSSGLDTYGAAAKAVRLTAESLRRR